MRKLIGSICLMLTLALVAPAQAAFKQSWDFVRSGKMVQLVYGVPDSHELTILFRCEGNPKRIEIVSTVVSRNPKKGQAVTTTLRNGPIVAAYEGKLGRDSDDAGFHFVASTAAVSKVTDILKAGSSLMIAISSKQERVPLRGVARPLAQFEKACFGAKIASAGR